MRLYFHPQGFQRTIGRDEWKSIWRWKRVITKQLEDQERTKVEMLRNHKLPEYIKQDIMNELCFPPIIMHDSQQIGVYSAGFLQQSLV